MNLHALVRGVIPIVNPDETVLWYRNAGQTHSDYGIETPSFAAPVSVTAQVQSESDASLYYQERAGDNSIIRRFYLMASPSAYAAGIVRIDARGGDVLRREDGSWWLVEGVIDDFSFKSGWVCVRGVLQNVVPDGIPQEQGNGGN